ncbi:MAG: hypothetical protein IPP72_10510 [Chitinophagaceae bacterium]|nr:hypothetical protein [Chitinophagaceae bacterium]
MSNKKPFEYIEDKIKLAAENNQPAFDEKAWEGMELLMGKDKKKKRTAYWWWLAVPLLLAGGLGAYKWMLPATTPAEKAASVVNTEKRINAENKEKSAVTVIDNADAVAVLVQKEDNNTKIQAVNSASINVVVKNVPLEKSKSISVSPKRKISGRLNSKVRSNVQGAVVADELPVSLEKIALGERVDSNNIAGEPLEIPASKKIAADNVTSPITETSSNPQEKEQGKVKTGNKEAPAVVDEKKPVTKKNSNKNSKGFYLLATGGTDAGSVKLFSYANCSITAKYGVGAGYQLHNKWSIQTGVYITNKKYVAGPGDYHPKANSYWNTVHIMSVKAACLVYEIPLTVKYTFIQRPAVSYYGTVGISSYIMKKEDYNYYYTRYDTPYEKSWQYTGNQHLFAALTFSMGIEKTVSKRFSLLVEPSFSIPLSGVGDGKIKLFSSSLQAGFKCFPFKK